MSVRQLSLVSIVFATAALGLACFLQVQWIGLLGAVWLGILWLSGVVSGRSWLAGWCLTLFTLLSALAVLFAASPALVLLGMSVALLAYDLSMFERRLASAVPEQQALLARLHVRQVLLITGLGLLAGELALLLRLQLGFFWLLVLGIAAVLALAFVARQTLFAERG